MRNAQKNKLLFITTLLLLLCLNLNAQKTKSQNAIKQKPYKYKQGFRVGFGLNVGPVFSKPYTLALGLDGRLQYDLSKRYSFTLTTGFTNLFATGNSKDLGFIPLKAGFKGFVWNDQFYVMGEIGPAFAVTNNYDKTAIIIAPSIGFATKYIDISLRFEQYSNFPTISNNTKGEGTGQLALRLAYGFRLK